MHNISYVVCVYDVMKCDVSVTTALTEDPFCRPGFSGAFLTGVGEFLLLPTLVTEVVLAGDKPGAFR